MSPEGTLGGKGSGESHCGGQQAELWLGSSGNGALASITGH